MERLPKGRYASRSSAVRAARAACRKALNAPGYQAAEHHDYEVTQDYIIEHDDRVPFFTWHFKIVGPAKEAESNPALATGFSA